MNEIAMWLGYGVMVLGGLLLILAAIGFVSALICEKVGSLYRALQSHYGLKVLRDTLSQLRAEGRIRQKECGDG